MGVGRGKKGDILGVVSAHYTLKRLGRKEGLPSLLRYTAKSS